MKIRAVETIRVERHRSILFVLVYSDDGLVGLGESFFNPSVVESYVHTELAPILFALDNPSPEKFGDRATSYLGYQGAGIETRARAAVDLALWDLLGHRSGLPLCELLGGPVKSSIPVYNTCAGPGYVAENSQQHSANWGLAGEDSTAWDDLRRFLTEPAELARELLSCGVRGMKIWPFDMAAEATGGTWITPTQLDQGLRTVSEIRDAVGDQIDIMIELHGLWDRPPAERIINSLAPFRPRWVEDPVRGDATHALSQLRRNVDVPIATGETIVGRRGFRELLEAGALDVATADVQWTGGITEARKVASLCDSYSVPIAPHDCTGPATLAACLHLVTSQPNGLIQETVRSFLHTWYRDLTTGLPDVVDGSMCVPSGAGHGISLVDGLRQRPDVHVQRTDA